MKKSYLLVFIFLMLLNCYVPVRRDYQGMSKSLVFNKNKKWLINDAYTDLNATQREELNLKILQTFQELSSGNAATVLEAKKQNLIPSKISLNPTLEELEALQGSQYDYLVNVRTKIVKDQIASLEIEKPLQYSKNEAFAIVEIFDLKTLKRCYYQKASSQTERNPQKTYPEYSGQELYNEKINGKDKGPYLAYSASALSIKNLKKILKDIEKNAIK